MASHTHRSWIEVSRPQVAANFRAIQRQVGPQVEVVPVVKADAYRHGAVEMSRVLTAEGARWLAVSNVEEGVCLREAGVSARLLVMADFLPASRPALLNHGLTPVLHCLDELPALDDLARRRGEPVAYHLKLDTGMGRLGTRATPECVAAAIRSATHARLEGLMTHFASAADYDLAQTDEQVAAFNRMRDALRRCGIHPRYVHLSSTIPIAYNRREAWGDMVRPGISVYGYVSPARGAAPPMTLRVQPALAWKASVLCVKEVEAGALIGYGGMFRAPRPMRIAIVAAGYADGIPHRLSNRGKLIACGRLTPILGAVSMDLTTIDASHCPALQVGDPVTILGQEGEASIDAQQIARWAGTISYSVLCGITARVKREYV